MGSSSGALALAVAVGASCASAGTCDQEEIRRRIIASPSATNESASRECAEDRGNKRGSTTDRAAAPDPTPEKAKLGPIARNVHNEIILCILDMLANRVTEPQKRCDEVFAEKMRTAKAQDESNARALEGRNEGAKRPPVRIGMTKTEVLAAGFLPLFRVDLGNSTPETVVLTVLNEIVDDEATTSPAYRSGRP